MIENDLVVELNLAIEKNGGVASLPAQVAEERVKKIAESFVSDPARRWWWDSIIGPSKRIAYDTADGLARLAELVKQDSDVDLIVTDDSDPPWPVYSGDAKSIIDVLRDCRFFEYILAARDGSWIVFDTHMNELVIAGQLV